MGFGLNVVACDCNSQKSYPLRLCFINYVNLISLVLVGAYTFFSNKSFSSKVLNLIFTLLSIKKMCRKMGYVIIYL